MYVKLKKNRTIENLYLNPIITKNDDIKHKTNTK